MLALDQQVEVPVGHFTDVILTEDYTPVEPDVSRATSSTPRASGRCSRVTVSGGSEREELISYTK